VSEQEIDLFIAKVARELKEPVELDAQFDARVMAALAPEVISLDSRRVQQPWYRRRLAVPAPVAGLAAAAAFAGIAAVGMLARQPGASSVAGTPSGALVPVNDAPGREPMLTAPAQFVLVAPPTSRVELIGSFNDWTPTPMTFDVETQAWRLTLALPVGVHEYQFLVNGTQRVVDPTASLTPSDFGSPNSVVKVTPIP
jgi:Glycogen recognition site of AMP-activated protein kinase